MKLLIRYITLAAFAYFSGILLLRFISLSSGLAYMTDRRFYISDKPIQFRIACGAQF